MQLAHEIRRFQSRHQVADRFGSVSPDFDERSPGIQKEDLTTDMAMAKG
jgi:hypothetical protein